MNKAINLDSVRSGLKGKRLVGFKPVAGGKKKGASKIGQPKQGLAKIGSKKEGSPCRQKEQTP